MKSHAQMEPTIVNQITVDGWYLMSDGRFASVAWHKGQPRIVATADDPATYDADLASGEAEYIEARAEEADRRHGVGGSTDQEEYQ